MKPRLLVVDLDDTLLGDSAATDGVCAWHATRRRRIRLIYASGRTYESIVRSTRKSPLPVPEALICGVGTDLRHFESGSPVAGWRDQTVHDWSARRVRDACAQFDALVLQPDEFQSEFKVSYVGRQLTWPQLSRIYAALCDARLAVNLVYGSKGDLDILPAGVDKGAAAAYLVRQGRWSDRQVLVAGNSGNDVALFQQGFRGIVVANAEPILLGLAGPEVYVSPFAFAHGVIDGLCHWLGEPDDGHLRTVDFQTFQVAQAMLAPKG